MAHELAVQPSDREERTPVADLAVPRGEHYRTRQKAVLGEHVFFTGLRNPETTS